jgi:hypothetical protein
MEIKRRLMAYNPYLGQRQRPIAQPTPPMENDHQENGKNQDNEVRAK